MSVGWRLTILGCQGIAPIDRAYAQSTTFTPTAGGLLMRLSAIRMKTGVWWGARIFALAVLAALSLSLSSARVFAQSCLTDKDATRIYTIENRLKVLDYQRAEAQVELASGKLQQAAAEAEAKEKEAFNNFIKAKNAYEAAAANAKGNLREEYERTQAAHTSAARESRKAKENLRLAELRVARLTREIARYTNEIAAIKAKPVCAPGKTTTPAPRQAKKKQAPDVTIGFGIDLGRDRERRHPDSRERERFRPGIGIELGR